MSTTKYVFPTCRGPARTFPKRLSCEPKQMEQFNKQIVCFIPYAIIWGLRTIISTVQSSLRPCPGSGTVLDRARTRGLFIQSLPWLKKTKQERWQTESQNQA